MSKKKKKEKIIYIDDGSTVADMSGTSRKPRKQKEKTPKGIPQYATETRGKAIWRTYWESVRMMLIPMFVVIGVICLVFLILRLSFGG